ncbi:MAG: hypothetical protein C9356_07760 [Oleiphilus sp.]|nr:MAG: hypothetical protein C9356_07760 [Oleiphilus sp.]
MRIKADRFQRFLGQRWIINRRAQKIRNEFNKLFSKAECAESCDLKIMYFIDGSTSGPDGSKRGPD